MKRRKFIHRLLAAGAVILTGAARRVNKVMPRRFTWAAKPRNYPGGFKAPNDILSQGKWSG